MAGGEVVDFKVSRKETRMQPEGPVEVLADNVFDLYPVYADDPRYDGQDIYIGQERVSEQDRKNIIMDVETVEGDRAELLDRAMWALVKQRGGDPVEPGDGVQWAEAVIGEVVAPVIIQQVRASVSEEGPGVRVVPGTVSGNGRESLVFKIELANAV
jgi:hypothetical protein